jgi:hypothetical protein
MKKVYITGTSRGIGTELKSLPFEVIATSRVDGYDIDKNYDKVLSSIIQSDSDVFINNAYAPKYQTKLLIDV